VLFRPLQAGSLCYVVVFALPIAYQRGKRAGVAFPDVYATRQDRYHTHQIEQSVVVFKQWLQMEPKSPEHS